VHQVLRRGGCSRRPAPERPAVVRYEWPCPGNLLHMDVKKFGKFTEPGHAVTANRTKRSRRVGWEYCHSIVDDCSRLAYSELHDDERADTVTAFTQWALDFFLAHGIVAERLMTNNAFSYIKNRSLRQLLARRAIHHIRTRPYTPRTNGKVERYQQTLQREWPTHSNTRQAMHVGRRCHTGWATTTSGAPTAPSATKLPSPAFGTSPGTTPRRRRRRLRYPLPVIARLSRRECGRRAGWSSRRRAWGVRTDKPNRPGCGVVASSTGRLTAWSSSPIRSRGPRCPSRCGCSDASAIAGNAALSTCWVAA